MAFADHTNTDVQRHVIAGNEDKAPALILGQFIEKEFGNTFEFLERDDRIFPASLFPDLPHMIAVGDRGYRLANVLKTVAYIQTDEGLTDRQKWDIKGHRAYDTEWVFASR